MVLLGRIALDAFALFVIVKILTRLHMTAAGGWFTEDWTRVFMFAGGLAAVGIVASFAGAPLAEALAISFTVVCLGMRFAAGASWPGAVIGSVAFILWKAGLEQLLAILRG